jgi:outer membrane biosynthesis protein TonB
MNSIHSLQIGQACAFDFIQAVVTSVTATLEKTAKHAVIQKEEQQVAEYYEKHQRQARAEAEARQGLLSPNTPSQMESNKKPAPGKASKAPETKVEKKQDSKVQEPPAQITQNQGKKKKGKVPEPEPIPEKKVATMPEKKWTELPEYRSAYLQALNEGLNGQGARDRARGLLVNVLADVRTSF